MTNLNMNKIYGELFHPFEQFPISPTKFHCTMINVTASLGFILHFSVETECFLCQI